MIIKFTIDGQPQGKGRPIYSRKSNAMRTPEKTIIYENLVKMSYRQQCKGLFFEKGVPLAMEIVAFYKMPQASKKKTEQMLSGEIRPTTKPDLDNVMKCIADSLNVLAYQDDSQIVSCRISKMYAMHPFVSVEIREVMSSGASKM